MSVASESSLAALGRYHVEDGLVAAAESLRHYGPQFDTWSVAFSGGKDSSGLVTVLEHLFSTGAIERPTNLYAVQINTLVELPPLHANSLSMKSQLRERGWKVICRTPKPLERLWVQMLGRGLPPANQQYNWWCTRSTKQRPQERVYSMLRARHGKLLTIYGSRVDESDARAARIAKSCTAAGTECGLGLFSTASDKLAPLVGWRNCAVWDWLQLCRLGLAATVPAAHRHRCDPAMGSLCRR